MLFTLTQFVIIFLHIHKQSLAIKLSYQRQKREQQRAQLQKQIQELKYALYQVQDYSAIKAYATHTLHMVPATFNQIKMLHDYLAP